MLALKGIYENGIITVEKPPQSDKPMMVVVKFLKEYEEEKPLVLENFSFMKTRERLRKYNFSLSGAVIEERREIL